MVVCSPLSGSTFPVCTSPAGATIITPVDCTATDQADNSSDGDFTVTVEDTTPPDLTAPASITVECNATGGVPSSDPAIQAFLNGASAIDIVDPSPGITNDAPAFCNLGVTTVKFTATDAVGNSSSASPTITVVDTTAPTVTAALVAVGEQDDDEGRFRVEFSCSDICDDEPDVTSAKLNGIDVFNGQIVELDLEEDDEQEVDTDDGVLQIEASSFELVVICEDASGNVGTATATPTFAGDDDDDDDDGDDDDDDDDDD